MSKFFTNVSAICLYGLIGAISAFGMAASARAAMVKDAFQPVAEGATFTSAPTSSALQTVTIAVAGNFSVRTDGSATPYGSQMLRGIQLALQESDEDLKNSGLAVQLRFFENQGLAASVKTSAHAAAQSDAVAVIGHMFSSEALLAAPVYENSLLFVSPGASAARLKKQYGDVFRTASLSNASQAQKIVSQLRAEGVRSFGVIDVADCSYCTDLAKQIVEVAQSAGLQQRFHRHVLSSADNFKDLAGQIQEQDLAVDAVILPNYEMVNANLIAALAPSLRGHVLFVGGDGWGQASQAFFKTLNGLSFDGISLGYWSDRLEDAASKHLRRQSLDEFGQEPTDGSILAYASMKYIVRVLLRAKIQSGDITRATVLKAAQERPSVGARLVEIRYEHGKLSAAKLLPPVQEDL